MTSLVVVCKPCMFTEPAPSHNNQSESSTKKLRSNTEPHLSASQNEINILEMDDDVIAGSPPLVPPPTASRPRPVPPKSLGPGIRGPPLHAPGTPHTSDRYMIYTSIWLCMSLKPACSSPNDMNDYYHYTLLCVELHILFWWMIYEYPFFSISLSLKCFLNSNVGMSVSID